MFETNGYAEPTYGGALNHEPREDSHDRPVLVRQKGRLIVVDPVGKAQRKLRHASSSAPSKELDIGLFDRLGSVADNDFIGHVRHGIGDDGLLSIHPKAHGNFRAQDEALRADE
ncbi:hypothetical protein D3C81_1474890 [compost metagenome]